MEKLHASGLAGNDTHRGQGLPHRPELAAVSRKKLAAVLSVTFVLQSAVYVGAVTAGGGRIEPVVFLALAGFLSCPFLLRLLAPGLTGKERVKVTGKGRVPFELEDPDWQRRMREETPPAPEATPDRRSR